MRQLKQKKRFLEQRFYVKLPPKYTNSYIDHGILRETSFENTYLKSSQEVLGRDQRSDVEVMNTLVTVNSF